MRTDWRGWRLGRSGPAEFAGLLLVGLFMAAFSAFDSGELSPALRYAYWLTVMVGGGVIAALIEPLLLRWPLLAARPRLFAAIQTLAMTPPITLLVWTTSGLMLGMRPTLGHFLVLLPSVLVVDIAVVILAWLLRRATARMAPPPVSSGAPPAALRAKLSPKLGRAELLAVQAEDHYLRIHTGAGDALVLMRLADALQALEGCDGVRVHRSWWVARAAVDEARWSRGRGVLHLKNGLRVPVSRTYAPGLRAFGWAEPYRS